MYFGVDNHTPALLGRGLRMIPFRKPANFERGKGAVHTMAFTASEAAKEVGKSLPTITKAISSGKLSAEGPKGGPYSIQPAELFRVWPRVEGDPAETSKLRADETPVYPKGLGANLEVMNEKLRSAEVLNERLADEVADLRRRLDSEAEERRKLTAMLTHQARMPVPAAPVAPAPDTPVSGQGRPVRGLWAWLRGNPPSNDETRS